MKLTQPFKYNYQDAGLVLFTFLPDSSLKLNLQLDPTMNPAGPSQAEIIFYAIKNFADIKQYFQHFKNLPAQTKVLDRLHCITKNSEYSYTIEFFNNQKLNITTTSANFNTAVREI